MEGEAHHPSRKVHLIPEDEEKYDDYAVAVTPTSRHLTGNAAREDSFCRSSALLQSIGSSVIHHQAATINRRLLSIQKRAHECLSDGDDNNDDDEQASPHQRRRIDSTTPESDSAASNSRESEQLSIFRQVERMKRMSYYLKTASIAQEQFFRDMQECLSEGF